MSDIAYIAAPEPLTCLLYHVNVNNTRIFSEKWGDHMKNPEVRHDLRIVKNYLRFRELIILYPILM